MIEEINNYLKRFLYLGDDEATVLSAWVLHTWQFDPAKTVTTGYVYLHSPEKQCGKSVALDVLNSLAKNATKVDSITSAALFGVIEGDGDRVGAPSILMDEIDATFYGRKDELLRQIINSGYKRSGKAIRSRGGRTREYSTFCPKVLAGIHNASLPDTISDRCIPVTLNRKPVEMELEYFAEYFVEDDFLLLQDKIEEWVEDNIDVIESYKFWRVPGMTDRQSEVSWPLLAAAHADGVDLSETLVRMFKKYESSSFNAEREFLMQIKEVIEVFGHRGKLSSNDMLEALDMPTTARGASLLATQMEMFGVESKNIRIGNKVVKGYELSQFASVFKDNGVE